MGLPFSPYESRRTACSVTVEGRSPFASSHCTRIRRVGFMNDCIVT